MESSLASLISEGNSAHDEGRTAVAASLYERASALKALGRCTDSEAVECLRRVLPLAIELHGKDSAQAVTA